LPKLSVVIPAYNEAGNIGALVAETFDAVPAELLGEVIVVDDCSTDATGAEVAALFGQYPGLRCLRHLSNAGQSAAMRSGIAAARFPVIGTLDGDGQNPPGDIAGLARHYAPDGPQLVGGIRAKRRDTVSKRLASRAANAIRRAVLHDDCPDTGCGIKVFDREVYMRLPFFHGQHRYLPALFRAYGCVTAYHPVGDRPRRHGQSKYTNWRRGVMGAYDLIGVSWLIRRTRFAATEELGRE